MASTNASTLQCQRLRQWRQDELASLFSTLTPGYQPIGPLRGQLMAIRGTGRWPRQLTALINATLALPINPWRGKSFNDNTGSNLWLSLRGLRMGHFGISHRNGIDGQPSLWLDYNRSDNPPLLRAIRGEARQLQPGLWLCRMLWQGPTQLQPLLWFTLEGHHHDA